MFFIENKRRAIPISLSHVSCYIRPLTSHAINNTCIPEIGFKCILRKNYDIILTIKATKVFLKYIDC